MRYLLLFIFAFQSHAQLSDFNHIDFQKADHNALVCRDEGLKNLPQLAYRLTSNLDTDVERFRSIYMWVCHNISNDYTLYLRNKRKKNRYKNDTVKLKAWNERFKKEVFKKLLKQDKTICTGYAYIVQKLAKLANLNCEIVHGYGKTSTTFIDELDLPNHSWNAVNLNGKWYLCDPTWSSGIPDPETNAFIFWYNNGYFLANPKLFAINHFPLNKKWSLLHKNFPSFEDFLAAPILYGKAYTNLIIHEAPKQMHQSISKNETVIFNYELLKPIDEENVYFLIDNGNSSKKVQPTFIKIKNNSLRMEQQFKNTGFYDVHLYIGDDLISTYTVKVNR